MSVKTPWSLSDFNSNRNVLSCMLLSLSETGAARFECFPTQALATEREPAEHQNIRPEN
jgi:hypothetical protein